MEIPYASYNASANLVSYLLTPATICLAVPLYQQVELLKKNYKAVVAGIVSGVLSSMISVLALALLFQFDHTSYVTFLPKSITTAIGMGISAELGGFVPSHRCCYLFSQESLEVLLPTRFSTFCILKNLLLRALPLVVHRTPWEQPMPWN